MKWIRTLMALTVISIVGCNGKSATQNDTNLEHGSLMEPFRGENLAYILNQVSTGSTKNPPPELLEKKYLDFANIECAASYTKMNQVHKKICRKLIAAYCQGINTKSAEVEPVPLYWRPTVPPVEYFNDLETSEHQNQFTCALYPYLMEANQNVSYERGALVGIREREKKNGASGLGFSDDLFLKKIWEKYEIKNKYIITDRHGGRQIDWESLFNKVDVVPASMLLAQAADESNWMTSRFANMANNIFGRHHLPSCKLNVECVGAKGSRVRVILFSSLETAVDNQVRYMNRHWNYKLFRKLRLDLRKEGAGVQGYEVAPGLVTYSSKKGEYVRIIRSNMSVSTNWVKYDNIDTFRQDPARDILLQLASLEQ